MMLKFSSEQLHQLQAGLSVPPPPALRVPDPPAAIAVVNVARGKRATPDSDTLECEVHIPFFAVSIGYLVLFAGLGAWALTGGAPDSRPLRVLGLALGGLLVLHAVVTKSKPILSCTGILVGGLFYLELHCVPCVHLWCVGLSGVFVLHTKRKVRPVAWAAFLACLCSCAAAVLHPSTPVHLRLGGTILSLAVGSIASCVPQQGGHVRVRVQTSV